MLRDEARARGQEPTREVLRGISAEWRRESGDLGVLIDKAIEQYQQVADTYPGGLVIASIRNPGEADRLHERGGVVVWVDADPRVRYDRIQANAEARDRAEEDRLSFTEFQEQEAAEMTTNGDAATLNMSGVKAKSDICIDNNFDTLSDFMDHAETILTAS